MRERERESERRGGGGGEINLKFFYQLKLLI